MKIRMTQDDYMAVLLARAEVKDCPAALACCDMFLAGAEVIKEPSFVELSQPPEDIILEPFSQTAIVELNDSIARLEKFLKEGVL